MIIILELSFLLAARSSFFVSRQRRKLALSALGLNHQVDSALVQSLPVRDPFLVMTFFLDAVDKEIGMKKRAKSEVATNLRQRLTSRSPHPSRPYSRPFGSAQRTHPRVRRSRAGPSQSGLSSSSFLRRGSSSRRGPSASRG